MQHSWRKAVIRSEENNEVVNFERLVSFIDVESRSVNHPVYSVEALFELDNTKKSAKSGHAHSRSTRKALSAATKVELSTSSIQAKAITATISSSKYCMMCNKSNNLDECRNYLKGSLEDRKAYVKENGLCFACLIPTSSDHRARSCQRRLVCKTCNRKHPTSLHDVRLEHRQAYHAGNQNTEPKSLISLATATGDSCTVMPVVQVRMWNQRDPHNERVIYAALDSLSSACFISKEVWRMLGSPGSPTEIIVKTRKNWNLLQSTNCLLHHSQAVKP